MAENTSKYFPMLPEKHWWTLREKFKQSIPGVVTDSYLAAILNIQVASARANVLPYLRIIGLIDDKNKTNTDLAKAWRDDDQYVDVCRQIREKIYPKELIDAVPSPSDDRPAAERWFAVHTGKGSSAVRRMMLFYKVLMDADVSKKAMKTALSESLRGAT